MQLWQDLKQLDGEEGNLSVFRPAQRLYTVDVEPPNFVIQKARATKSGTEYFVQLTGCIEDQFCIGPSGCFTGFWSNAGSYNPFFLSKL
ncbi:hypothetical protein [Larkinella punicea]|uniref:hypothetical protein n=1 Tax=Larkinella punicea TaxID=2315727 RepID=UPI00105901C8|nr:hypothetical protein [Larkinella punicea]